MTHQLEHGYTKIANTLLEYFYQAPLSGAGFRIVFWIIRNSYGYHRKRTKAISIRKLAEEINMEGIGAVHLAIQVLLEKGIIIRHESGEYELDKKQLFISVPKTEQSGVFPKLNGSVPKTERSVPKTEHLNILNSKENLKDSKDRAIPPSFESVKAYCGERGNLVNPQKWFDHYTANGWMVGKNRMKDWRAAIRTWEHNSIGNASKSSVLRPIVDTEWKPEYDFNLEDAKFKGGR